MLIFNRGGKNGHNFRANVRFYERKCLTTDKKVRKKSISGSPLGSSFSIGQNGHLETIQKKYRRKT